MSTSVSTSLTSIKGVLGAVKTKAKSVVGLGAGPAPIAVEQDPLYEAEVARIEELVAPVAGCVDGAWSCCCWWHEDEQNRRWFSGTVVFF